MDKPSLRERLEALGGAVIAPERRGPEYFAKFIPMEIQKWDKVIRAANIKAE
jgi:hypothetical protein